jgi:Flp pilus assembly pilin Flp
MILLSKELSNIFKRRQDKAQTLIEYALIIGLILIVVIVAIKLLGPQIAVFYNAITNNL